MKMIYSEALEVQAWLGEAHSGFVDPLAKLQTWLGTAKQLSFDQMKHSVVQGKLLENLDLADSLLDAVKSLCQNPCWQRLWIMQKMILPDTIIFWYGAYTYTKKSYSKLFLYSGT